MQEQADQMVVERIQAGSGVDYKIGQGRYRPVAGFQAGIFIVRRVEKRGQQPPRLIDVFIFNNGAEVIIDKPVGQRIIIEDKTQDRQQEQGWNGLKGPLGRTAGRSVVPLRQSVSIRLFFRFFFTHCKSSKDPGSEGQASDLDGTHGCLRANLCY